MKTIKVAEATKLQLNWLVARIEGDELPKSGGKGLDYSSDWAHGGPIFDRERITIRQWTDMPIIHAYMPHDGAPWGAGPTPLIAAMRCLITSKLGREVEVPEEFL